MKTKKQIALLPFLMLLAGCDEKVSLPSETTKPDTTPVVTEPNDTSKITEDKVTEAPILPTAALTDEMMSEMKVAYAVDFTFNITYEGGGNGSSYHYIASCGSDGYAYESYYHKDGSEQFVSDVHIQNKEGDPYTYDASLGLDNTIWYKNLTATDKFSQEEYDVEWADAGYSNLFAVLSSSDFTKEDDNTFALSDEKLSELKYSLNNQLFSPYDLYASKTDPKSFKLKTNGSNIVGFELEFLPYSSYESISYYKSSGTFTQFGASAFKKLTPIEGEAKPELDAILRKLKGTDGKQNYDIHQTQFQFDFDMKKMVSMGEMDIKVQDGDKAHWVYRNTAGKRTADYGYYSQKDDEGNDCKRGVIQIGENYYNDVYLYSGSMKEYLPSFNFSSVLFEKDTDASKDGKVVYRLRHDFHFSTDNNSTFFTPEEMDAYRDRLTFVTITEEGDKITIRNSTGRDGTESEGLILNCEFTNIGKVTGLFAPEHMKENVDDLKWTDLLSRNEATRDSIVSCYTAEVLDSIPTLGGTWSNVYVDAANGAKPIFYVNTYEEATNNELMTDMSDKLTNAGFNAYTPSALSEAQQTHKFFRKNVDIKNQGKVRTYSLNIELTPWWNTQLFEGQFQISLSLSAAVK